MIITFLELLNYKIKYFYDNLIFTAKIINGAI